MKWNHIMDKQPEEGRQIIQIDRPYEGHYPIEMRKYVQCASWEDHMQYCESIQLFPDFWWLYVEDFPFPDQPERLNELASKEDAIV